MRWLVVATIVLLIGRPMTAQTPKARDLIGQWRRQTDTTLVVTFTDSTFTFPKVAQAQMNGKSQPVDVITQWGLAKDTLTFIKARAVMGNMAIPQLASQAKQVFGNDTIRLLTLKGRVLTMKTRDGKRSFVYERVGTMATSSAAKSERYNPLIEHP